MNRIPNDTTILIVDDDADVLRGTESVLQHAGFTTICAGDGEEALRIVAARSPHVVLLDGDMPGMNGPEVCGRIKGNAAFADSMVLMTFAAFAEGRHRVEGLQKGADGFIARPVTDVELVAQVEAFARISTLGRELRKKSVEAEAALTALRHRQLAELNLLEDAVAERKKAEAVLTELRVKDNAIESAFNAVAITDMNGRMSYVNAAFIRMFGFADKSEIVGRMQEEFTGDPGAARLAMAQIRETGSSVGVLKGRRKDGSLFSAEISASAVKDGQGRVTNLVASIVDVTRRKQAEETIQNSERRFRETLDQLLEGCMIIGFDWTYLYVNNAAARHGHQERANLTGRKMTEIYPGVEQSEVFAAYHSVMKERRPRQFEGSFNFADGATAWFQFHVTPVSQGIFVMSQEITASKEASERDSALLELEMAASAVDEKKLLQIGLDKLQHLTHSQIGFLHFVNDNQDEIELVTWTTDTMASYCRVAYDSHYPVSSAGVWADSIREKRPVIVNDYATVSGKKGLPEGHAHLHRFVSVPVLEGGLVRMIVGVGNAARDYDEKDVATISQFAYEMYRMVQRKRTDIALQENEAELRIAEEKFRGIVEQSMVGVYMLDLDKVLYANPRAAEIFGHAAAELEGKPLTAMIVDEDRKAVAQLIGRIHRGEAESGRIEYKLQRKDGEIIIVGTEVRRAQLAGKTVVMGVLQDVTSRVRSEQMERQYTARLERAMLGTVDAVSQMMDMRDPYTSGHEKRVGELSARIAAEMGLDETFQRGLRVAGGVHDVGKITVPAEILGKPGKITAIEFEIIKTHAEQGYEVLKGVDFPWPVAEVARQHHERIDGSGYPRGLKGDAILFEARILAVADVIEAMATHRPYRPSLGIDAALAEIERGRGSAFDPAVVDACLRLFRDKGYRLPEI